MLHARGDVSDADILERLDKEYAPRTWRCFHSQPYSLHVMRVCSTHVEMFPSQKPNSLTQRGMLHARGDVSIEILTGSSGSEYAPRTWRCFSHAHLLYNDLEVCSTHVEMFLIYKEASKAIECMLHARGDVSVFDTMRDSCYRYAPRTWRCFFLSKWLSKTIPVCSTHVEMFQEISTVEAFKIGMLHARGDVSRSITSFGSVVSYAPRTWRCFPDQRRGVP